MIFYKRKYQVQLDPEREAIETIGIKEGLSHLILSMISPGDQVIIPDPLLPDS